MRPRRRPRTAIVSAAAKRKIEARERSEAEIRHAMAVLRWAVPQYYEVKR